MYQEPDHVNLKQKTISGIGWNGAGNILRQGLQLITMVVMARFLPPEDFGVYAILMVFVSFMQVLGLMGTAQVIVYMDAPDQRMLSSIFYFNMVIGISLFVILFFISWPLAILFDEYRLSSLLKVIGFSFIISALSLVQKSLIEKKMLFKKLVVMEFIAVASGSVAGISFAVAGWGIYSLLIMTLINASILSVGLWVNSRWRPALQFSFEDIKQVWSYTFNLTSFNIINYFARNADTFLIGKYIGSSSLGIYNVAYRIMLYPIENVSRVMVRVLFPAFSQVKRDNIRFKDAYLKAITFIALLTFPLMAGLFAVAYNFVMVVLGERWTEMTVLLMILAPIGMVQSIVTTVGSIYTAKGTTTLMLKIGGANSFVTVVSFIIGLPYGIEGVGISYGVANLVMLYPNLKYSWDQIDLTVSEGIAKIAPFFWISLGMSVIVLLQGEWLAENDISTHLMLSLQILTGACVYVGFLLLFFRPLVFSLINEFKGIKRLDQ